MELANEIRLKYFAKALAKNLTNPGACKLLKHEIGKKFDGDFDALWETVRDENISGKGKFRKLISNRLSKGKGSFISIDDVEEVPLLQISLPVNFEDWDGEKPILVACTPLTIDDIEVEEIYAYDSEGNEYVLDAKNPPDFPVMVVGINERVDQSTEQFTKERGLEKVTSIIPVYVSSFRLMHDKEPWYKGAPEIYVKVKKDYQGNEYFERTNFTKVNKEKLYKEEDYSWLPKQIYSFSSYPEPKLRIEVWEDDSGNNDDLVEHEWCYPYPDSEASNYTPMGAKLWWYGDHDNADLKFYATDL